LLNDEHFRVAVGLRLGSALAEPYRCSCGALINKQAVHRLSCVKTSRATEARHNTVNDVLIRGMKQAGMNVAAEPSGLSTHDRSRPDGITLRPWSRGIPLAWDVTVSDTYAEGYRSLALSGVGSVIRKAERDKRRQYAHLENEYIFMTLGLESSGVCDKEALQLTKELGKALADRTGEDRLTSFLRQRLSLEVQRGNAQIILEDMVTAEDYDDLF